MSVFISTYKYFDYFSHIIAYLDVITWKYAKSKPENLKIRISRILSYLRLIMPLIEYVKYDQPRIRRIQKY